MKWSDIRQIGVWAVATAAVAIAAVGFGQSIAQDSASPGQPTKNAGVAIGSVVFSGTVVPREVAPGETATISVTALNKGDTGTVVSGSISVLRIEFKGNPLSRVVGPSDTVKTKVHSLPLSMTLKPGESKSVTFAFTPTEKGQPHKDEGGLAFLSAPTYSVEVTTKDGQNTAVSFRVVPKIETR